MFFARGGVKGRIKKTVRKTIKALIPKAHAGEVFSQRTPMIPLPIKTAMPFKK
jgi:hypothetical protein